MFKHIYIVHICLICYVSSRVMCGISQRDLQIEMHVNIMRNDNWKMHSTLG
jgi:hypothetical protein